MQHADSAVSVLETSPTPHVPLAVSHRCVSFGSGGRWHDFIYFYNVNRKAKDNKATQVYWHFNPKLFKVFINAICVR